MEQTERIKTAAMGGLFKILISFIGIPIILGILLVGIVLTSLLIYQNEKDSTGVIGGEPTELALNMIPNEYIPIYQAAAKMYGVPWNLLAAHHKVETDFSRIKVMISPVGAQGHFQFMPLTWIGWSYPGGSRLGNASIPYEILTDPAMIQKYGGFGTDGNGDGIADPLNLEDAIFSAANYLAANGAAEGNIEKAVFAYNHADWYVTEVLEYANTFASIGTNAVSTDGVAWPVPGVMGISSPFGYRTDPIYGGSAFHGAIDINEPGSGDLGKPVVSFSDGVVTHAGVLGGYGNAITIDHGNSTITNYGHLSGIDVKVGQKVKAGETIGKLGSTGKSSGPHLDFTIKVQGQPVDPLKYLSNFQYVML